MNCIKYKNIFKTLFLFIFISGCSNVAGEASFEPYAIPLRLSVNTWGEINLQVDADVEIPTPLGTASVGVIVDPTRHFEVQKVLTVRLNNEEYYYDLHGQDFTIEFQSGFYEKIKLSNEDGNIILELKRSDDSVLEPTYIPSQIPVSTKQLPTRTPSSQPQAILSDIQKVGSCEWHVYIVLTNFSPENIVSVNSRGTRYDCATGIASIYSWTQNWDSPTDNSGYLSVAYIHKDYGTYVYEFTDKSGLSATVTVTYTK